MKRKIIAVMSLSLLLASLFGTSVMACGGHHGRGRARANDITYSACNIEGCSEYTNHMHDGYYYYGHNLEDGHDYHQFCNVEGCTLTDNHRHDGACYFGQSSCTGQGQGHGHHGIAY